MLVVGVTGRSGSGKSSVAQHYASLGYPVADGDAISREVSGENSDCLRELTQAFGSGILTPAGALDRKALAGVAFADEKKTKQLIAITHPYIMQESLRRVQLAKEQGHPLFFMDGAVIVGGPFEPYCDKLIVVVAEKRLSVSRIILRDGISKAAAYSRLAAQQPEEALRGAADYVIENNAGKEELLRQADAVLAELLALRRQDKEG